MYNICKTRTCRSNAAQVVVYSISVVQCTVQVRCCVVLKYSLVYCGSVVLSSVKVSLSGA